jgi:hypothetical protein
MDIRRFENLHVFFWLIKDMCWMLFCKPIAYAMILPTISLSIWILWASRKTMEIWINLAIFFWILANSYWMTVEFLGIDKEYKIYASIPFGIGLFCAIVYVCLEIKDWRNSKNELKKIVEI